MSRYDVADEYEPGSSNTVLRNFLGITDPQEIGVQEARTYLDAIRDSILEFDVDQNLTMEAVFDFHRKWLAKIYPFAGRFREVNLSKSSVAFCPVVHLREQSAVFDQQVLQRLTPCSKLSRFELPSALAEVHVEFILLHPFREGNGRTGRWIAMMMALQAGLPVLDFNEMSTHEGRQAYFNALRKGFAGSLEPAVELFERVIKLTLGEAS